MTDVFTWPVQANSSGGGSFRTKKAQFGDGYSQEVEDGLNAEEANVTVSIEGTADELAPVLAFARAHKAQSFLWTPPMDTQGLYRCRSFKWNAVDGGYRYLLTLEFERTYVP